MEFEKNDDIKPTLIALIESCELEKDSILVLSKHQSYWVINDPNEISDVINAFLSYHPHIMDSVFAHFLRTQHYQIINYLASYLAANQKDEIFFKELLQKNKIIRGN